MFIRDISTGVWLEILIKIVSTEIFLYGRISLIFVSAEMANTILVVVTAAACFAVVYMERYTQFQLFYLCDLKQNITLVLDSWRVSLSSCIGNGFMRSSLLLGYFSEHRVTYPTAAGSNDCNGKISTNADSHS